MLNAGNLLLEKAYCIFQGTQNLLQSEAANDLWYYAVKVNTGALDVMQREPRGTKVLSMRFQTPATLPSKPPTHSS